MFFHDSGIMNTFRYFWSVFLSSFLGLSGTNGQNARFVDPFIGTGKCDVPTLWGNYGGTFPGAVAPWGMIQLTPETSIRPSEVGYYYEDSCIRSFSCLRHLSGYPNGSAGDLHLIFWPNEIQALPEGYEGRPFSHDHEKAEPGYYAVSFNTGDRVEMTTAVRSGLFRYTTSSDQATIIVAGGGSLQMRDPYTIQASNMNAIIRFQEPYDSYELRNDSAFVHFSSGKIQGGLLVAISASTSGFEESEKNREAEIPGWDFNRLRKQTYDSWERELSCVTIQAGDENDLRQFYTALYHSFLFPNILSDVNGKYKGWYPEGGVMYGNFSPWDTFRTLHPLLSLLKPERQKAMVRSLIALHTKEGHFPFAPMTGLHYIPLIADACLKDASDTDAERLWEALLSYQAPNKAQPFRQEYIEQGFVAASREKSVSITTEYAYDDWALGRFAEMIGKDGSAFFKHSLNYRHLYDAETLFLLPREKDRFLRNAGELGYQESNKWTASYFVPHNIRDLIHLHGGDSCFVSRLRAGFENGQIHFDNEPVFHYPYLFTWAGRPDLTRKYVRQVLREAYRPTSGGLPGNDDLGSMSSWYVFSAMGIFPACPVSGEYLLADPLFDEILIHRPDQVELRIAKIGGAPDEGQLPTIRLGGQAISRWFVSHREWMEKGSILFDATTPSAKNNALIPPYSETTGEPVFKVSAMPPKESIQQPGNINKLPFHARNDGAIGSYVAELYSGGQMISSKRILLDTGESTTDTLFFTLYKEGAHQVSFQGKSYPIQVVDTLKEDRPFVCTDLSVPSLLAAGDSLRVSFRCQNISGRESAQTITAWMDSTQIYSIQIHLEPGEETTCSFPLTTNKAGFHDIRILDQGKRFKAYSCPLESSLLDLDFTKRQANRVPDQSGFGNDGIAHGPLRWGDDYVETGEQAYLTFPSSGSLMEARKTLTLLTWIAPQSPIQRHAYADFFTKGDYTLMKMEGPERLVFFAGGWGRGVCEIQVPEDWYTAWHQIAGVCTGNSLKIYIDGQLKQEIQVAGELEATEVPWNLGRNAEMPFSRFSKMRFSRTRIFGTALSDQDIRHLYEQEKALFH